MAILISNDGDIRVQTISDRNMLSKRFDGMKVTVTDATADSELGGGSAQYEWDGSAGKWVKIWSDVTKELRFSHEEKLLSGGKVTADFFPADQKVWDVKVLDSSDNILADIRPTVSLLGVIDIETTQYDGQTLSYSYAYGSFSAQMTSIIETLTSRITDLEEAVAAMAGV